MEFGSGKTLSAIRMMVKRGQKTYCNFDARMPNAQRLKVADIMTQEELQNEKTGEIKKGKLKLNVTFWRNATTDKDGFDIVIDEMQSLINARRAMSTWNINMTLWIAQIRKILGSAEQNDIIMITQVVQRIDVAFRDLMHEIIYCEKHEMKTLIPTRVMIGKKVVTRMMPKVLIVQYHFFGDNCVDNYNAHRAGVPKCYAYKDYFIGNKYFEYYNSFELIMFGETEFL